MLTAIAVFVPIVSVVGLYANLVVFACSQLEILRASIKNICQNPKSNNSADTSTMEEKIRECVCHHQEILK